jgi:hypothetical protein
MNSIISGGKDREEKGGARRGEEGEEVEGGGEGGGEGEGDRGERAGAEMGGMGEREKD